MESKELLSLVLMANRLDQMDGSLQRRRAIPIRLQSRSIGSVSDTLGSLLEFCLAVGLAIASQ